MDSLVTLRVQGCKRLSTGLSLLCIDGPDGSYRMSLPESALVSIEDAPVEFQPGDVFRMDDHATFYWWQRVADMWEPLGHARPAMSDFGVRANLDYDNACVVYRNAKPL